MEVIATCFEFIVFEEFVIYGSFLNSSVIQMALDMCIIILTVQGFTPLLIFPQQLMGYIYRLWKE